MPIPTRPEQVGLQFRESFQRIYASAAWALGVVALLKRLNRSQAVILSYHGFIGNGRRGPASGLPALSVPVLAFATHLRYLERHYTIVPLSRLVDWLDSGRPIPEGTAALTLDDGYMSAYSLAFPLLRRHRMPATVFLATDFVDRQKPFWWDLVVYLVRATSRRRVEIDLDGAPRSLPLETTHDREGAGRILVEQLVQMPEGKRTTFVDRLAEALGVGPEAVSSHETTDRPLTWAAIRQMAQEGVEFGSHTVTHTVLTRCTAECIERELVESGRMIEQQLGQPCELFCYPNGRAGDWDARTGAAVRKAGYRCAVTGIQGLVRAGDDVYTLRRIPASGHPFVFRTMVSGANPRALAETFSSWRNSGGRAAGRMS